MKLKKYIIPFSIIVIAGLLITFFFNQNRLNGSTIESRELRLREISNLGKVTTIDQEITIDGYIISGYTAKNNQYGLAVFVPAGNGKYNFQTNANRQNKELLFMTTIINEKQYNLFWANKADLDYAEITYMIDGKAGETIEMDAQNNQIIYTEAPSNDFSVEYYFVDINGNQYK